MPWSPLQASYFHIISRKENFLQQLWTSSTTLLLNWRSAKFGPRSTITHKFRPSQFFGAVGREFIVCLMHAERANHQTAVKTFFLVFKEIWAQIYQNCGVDFFFFGLQIAVKTFSGPNFLSSVTGP